MLTLGASFEPPGQDWNHGYPTQDHLDAYVEEEVLAFIPPTSRSSYWPRVSWTGSTWVCATTSQASARQGQFSVTSPFVACSSSGSQTDRTGTTVSSLKVCGGFPRMSRATTCERSIGERATGTATGKVSNLFEHYIDAEDWARCTELLKPLLHGLAEQELQQSIMQWLNRLPEHVVLADPELIYHVAVTMLTVGPRQQGREFYETWIKP